MKYFFVFLLMVFLLLESCISFGGGNADGVNSQAYDSGEIYEGAAAGYRGQIRVQVRMTAGSITEINLLDSIEDRFVGGAAIEELIDTVIEFNSTDVDVITGATFSSKGFLDAVNSAIMGL